MNQLGSIYCMSAAQFTVTIVNCDSDRVYSVPLVVGLFFSAVAFLDNGAVTIFRSEANLAFVCPPLSSHCGHCIFFIL